ncbi:MAG: peptidylprolyl isomerase [Gammaproteobacteria bacterium]|nr:peptidylprolyl isomerase [Gammaproteobacteria bacterium]
MQITKDKVVLINYTLKNDDGEVIDSSEGNDPLAYLHGAENIIPGLEKALEGKAMGDSVSVTVPPEEGYGTFDEGKVQAVPKDMFEDAGEVAVGSQYHAAGPDGGYITITVTEIGDDTVTVDANHPLAGENLSFDVEIVEIREASAEELEHGHVHGPGGHEH